MGLKRRRRGGKAPKHMPEGGRNPKNPHEIEPALDAYLARVKVQGLRLCPLDFKSIAQAIKKEGKDQGLTCSHTHFSPRGIASSPPQYRPKWQELRERVLRTREEIEGRRKTAVERLEAEVADLRQRLKEAETEKESLWIWMIQIEANLQDSGINTEMFLPEDLRYGRDERR